MAREMEKAKKAASSPKSSTISTGPKSPVRNGGGSSPPHKKNTTTTEARGRKHEQQNVRKGGDTLSHDESKPRRSSSTAAQTSPKRSPRHEQPLSYNRLHTEERAIRRAGYNYQVASKINTQEIIRRFEEKLAQVDEASDGAKGAEFPEAEMLHRWGVPSPFLLQWSQQQGHQVVVHT
ncbi:TPX2 (targeting protein for Xklp2) protein family [Zea mays]|uniref:TPX2 (Targeting protein for Xklp2) protein family n=1 Tax=Zea mays TaxID=4577 RepID=A0A1D6ENV4_MAIZE|nr:TPX2 (targeting protein for Xklp2) protein family [Zea mays]